MKLLVLTLIAIIIFVALLTILIWLYKVGQAEKPARQGPFNWEVELIESESHPITSVFLVRGSRREFWTSVDRLDDDYEDQLYQAKATAQDEATDRNAVNKALNQGNSK